MRWEKLASIYRKFIMFRPLFFERVHLGNFRFSCAWLVTVFMFGLWGLVGFICYAFFSDMIWQMVRVVSVPCFWCLWEHRVLRAWMRSFYRLSSLIAMRLMSIKQYHSKFHKRPFFRKQDEWVWEKNPSRFHMNLVQLHRTRGKWFGELNVACNLLGTWRKSEPL